MSKKDSRPYDLHIYKAGHSKVISVTKLLPRDWEWVRVTKAEGKNGALILTIKPITLTEG